MSYRSLKRVFSETNLERKCRLLFGITLLSLIAGAFWYAERNAEKLVEEKIQQTGQDYVDLSLLRLHIEEYWLKLGEQLDESLLKLAEELDDPTGRNAAQWNQALRRIIDTLQPLRDINRSLSTQHYAWEILVLDMESVIDAERKYTHLPQTEEERQLLLDLQARLQQQLSQPTQSTAGSGTQPADTIPLIPDVESSAASGQPASPSAADATAPTVSADGPSDGVGPMLDQPALTPVFTLQTHAGEYHYYQNVYWKNDCIVCHSVFGGKPFLASLSEVGGPLRVVKVRLPTAQTARSIISSRAILAVTAIVTVFLSMVALYLVVRYVIVKPLNHLRYVSDEVSRGNTNLRAEIETNDEFQELASSFNRMLRHLVDAQEELRKVNKDLDAKVDQLAQVNMQLHEMNRLKSDFLASMSHELRTPLNSIIGFADVLREISSLDDRQRRYAQNIASSGRVLLEMINDILDLAKLESGKMEVRITEFFIEPVVVAQCDTVRSLSEEKNIDLKVDVQSDLPPMRQDQAKIQQILTNLLSNAIKFTPEGGRITVSARRRPDTDLVLTVKDTGVGIAEEDRHVIFEKFRQGTAVLGRDTLTRQYSGTGLGLSIVKELCRLLDGEITFVSELGKGSEFTVRLPWTKSEPAYSESSLASRLEEVTRRTRLENRLTDVGAGSRS